MRNSIFSISIIFLLTFLNSCQQIEVTAEVENYFDLEVFVDELKEKSTEKVNIEKTVGLNGEKETKSLDLYDISQEVEMLRKYNINKANLAGKYTVSSNEEQGMTTTTYQATEDKLLTQTLTIKEEGDKLKEIIIQGHQKSLLSESQLTITFAPESRYHLLSEDNNRYSNDLVKEILITF